MKKRISKKSLLSLLTVSAIVVTMAGSYAVWDQLSDSTTATLKLDKPVVATMTLNDSFTAGTRTLGAVNDYTNTATFKVENLDGNSVKAKLTAVVKDITDASPTDVSDEFDVTIKKAGTEVTNGIDDNVAEGENTYEVTVTPRNSITDEKAVELAGKTLQVEMTGTLSEKTNP